MQWLKATKNAVVNAMSMAETNDKAVSQGKCPFHNTSPMKRAATDNDVWFPDRLNLRILQQKRANNPEDPDFDYKAAFSSLDLQAVKADIEKCLMTSQEWWPADYGNYGPFAIRLAWHVAGTYRVYDGRGGANTGNQRFAPLNSWPDNGNLDKARRLLWPIKQKYGRKLSWADLFMLAGNVAHEIMGLKTFGFGGGRVDIYSPEEDVYWGPESDMLDGSDRHDGAGNIEEPLAASEMGLIYVNPEGYENVPEPLESAKEIRATFGVMAMSDYETVALIAGGHTFGKSHGASTMDHVGPEPEKAPMEQLGLGYKNSYGTGKGKDTITSGLEGSWTQNPTKWDYSYLENLFKYEWETWKGPGGRHQWRPKSEVAGAYTPDAHEQGKKHKLMMFTTDLSLKEDPEFAKISKRFLENPQEFEQAYTKAWYKLTHRDMGPVNRLLGPEVPAEQKWQDPIPSCDHKLVNPSDIIQLKKDILSAVDEASSLTQASLIRTAWSSASTFRCTDYRGGANGARIRLSPQKDWECNNPTELAGVLAMLEDVQSKFNAKFESAEGKKVSMADLIVLGGNAAIEEAALKGGHDGTLIPFTPGRMDASQQDTDVEQFAYLEPKHDGFRNYNGVSKTGKSSSLKEEEMLVDKAHLLSLTAPEMAVLVAGLRTLNVPVDGNGVLTRAPGVLSNDFFVNLLDPNTEWSRKDLGVNGNNQVVYEAKNPSTGKVAWSSASRCDLIFGSCSELRAIAEYYATNDAKGIFVKDFCKAWNKVMELDRFDLKEETKM